MDADSNPTGHDVSRQDATGRDSYTLTIEEAALRYDHAGHPRTIRSIQRYCAQGHLDCLRQQTTFGDKYLITPESVARHIAQIAELASATRRGESRPDATSRATENLAPSSSDTPRQDATHPDMSPPVAGEQGRGAGSHSAHDNGYVDQLEKRIGEKDEVILLLKGQLTAKDGQIAELSTRYRETHALLGAMQRMLAPLLGQGDPYKAAASGGDGPGVDNPKP